jgi:[acyl-carrier-protein] S-malonyltransferase
VRLRAGRRMRPPRQFGAYRRLIIDARWRATRVRVTTRAALLFAGHEAATVRSRDLAWAACADLCAQASAIIGSDPFLRAAAGPEYAQPSAFLASIAGWRTYRAAVGDVLAIAGYAFGDLGALAVAGAAAPEDVLPLVIERGRLIQESLAKNAPLSALTLSGIRNEEAFQLASDYGLTVASDHAPDEVIVVGTPEAVDALARDARQDSFDASPAEHRGALPSPAFGSACDPLFEAAAAIPWRAPAVPVLNAATAAPFTDIPRQLADALVAPVRWRETIAALSALGVQAFVDASPTRQLARVVARDSATGAKRPRAHAAVGGTSRASR